MSALRYSAATVVLALLASGLAPATPAVAATPTRLVGASQYSLAIASSQAAFPASGTVPIVVVANGEDYQASAIAGAAASSLGGAVLFVKSASIPPTVAAELSRLAPDEIIVLGSTASISSSVYADLAEEVPSITRLGSGLIAGSEALARRAFSSGTDRAILVPTRDSPNLVSAAALAAATDSALLMLPPSETVVRASTASLLGDLGIAQATIIGGSGSLSTTYSRELKKLVVVDRISGEDKYDVAVAIAARFGAVDEVLIASDREVRSTVGALTRASTLRAPILITTPYCARPEVRAFVRDASGPRVNLVGTTAEIRGLVGSLEACRDINKASSTWALVNKKNKLDPSTYVPAGLRVPAVKRTGSHLLRDAAADALEDMAAAASSAGAGRVGLVSGYRSYSTQAALYARYVRENGQAWADSQSARAGYSEHQTGFAADLAACSASGCSSIYSIASTSQGKWLAANSHKYGFILRYENGKTSTTGYAFEPWHFRYVGKDLARDYHDGGFRTLETYLGEPAAPKY